MLAEAPPATPRPSTAHEALLSFPATSSFIPIQAPTVDTYSSLSKGAGASQTQGQRGTAVAICPQTSACPSIQAVATSSTLSVRAPRSRGLTSVGQTSAQQVWQTGALVSQGRVHHQESVPEDFAMAVITQGGVPPVLGWRWGGQLCVRGVVRTCLCLQEVTAATARPFKEKPPTT